MAYTTLIRNGTLVGASGERHGDLLIAGESIAAAGPDLAADGVDRIIDATGCVVLPGLVDPHTHIQLDTGIYRTPDDWEVGTRTAACGGVTTVLDFATQFAGQNVREALAERLAEIGSLAQIDYGLHMMLTVLPADDAALDDWMADLVTLGVPAVKVYTTYRPNYYQDDAGLLRVFAAAARHSITVMIHCENDAVVSTAREVLERDGKTSLAYHGRARPALAEVEAAHRALFLADAVGSVQPGVPRPRVYIVHCSVPETVEQVLAARAGGLDAVAETTPQYLILDEGVYSGEHPEWGIMQPPLREAGAKVLLWQQLADGAITTVGTDHCDYTISQKRAEREFTKTPGGIPGLETLLPLLATYGVAEGRITWSRLVEVASTNPARLFGLVTKGVLAPHMDADVVIYDPRATRTIRSSELHNLAGYTPYEGLLMQGAVRDVFIRGRQLVRDEVFQPARGWGRFTRGAVKA